MEEVLEIVIGSDGAVRGGRVVKRELGQISGEAAKTDKAMRGVGASLTDIAKIAAAGIGFAGIVASMREAISVSAQFQSALSNLSAITGATGKDLEYLSDQALEISKNSSTASRDVVEAFKLIGSAKPELLQSGAALAEVTKQAVILSEAAQLNLASAANSLTTSLNQFGAGADQAARYVNVLAAGSQLGSAEVDALAIAVQKSGTAANLAGLSFEELVGTIGTLAASGAPIDQIGTSLRNIFLKLQTGVDNFNPAVVGLTQSLKNLAAANLSVQDATKLFGLENVNVAIDLIKSADASDRLTQAITGTNTALKQQATNNDNLAGAFAKLGNAADNFYITVIGKSETLKNTVNSLTDAINSVTTAYADAKRAIVSDIEAIQTAHSQLWQAISLAFSGFTTILEAVAKSMRQAFEFLGLGFLGKSITDYGNDVIKMFKQISGAVGDLVNQTVIGMDHMDLAMQQRSSALDELARRRSTQPSGVTGGGAGGSGGVADTSKQFDALRQSLDAAYAAEMAYAEGQALINANVAKGTPLFEQLHFLLNSKYNVAMLEAGEGAKTTADKVADQVKAINAQTAALKISEREYRIVLQTQKLMQQDLTVSAERARELAEESVAAAEGFERLKQAQDDMAAASRNAAEEMKRQAEENQRLLEQPFLTAAENIQNAFASTFRDVLDNGISSFKDFGQVVLSLMKDLAAQVAALLVFKPQLLGGGAGGLAGALGFGTGSSVAGSAGNTAARGASGGGALAAYESQGLFANFDFSGALAGGLAGFGVGQGIASVAGLNSTGALAGGAVGAIGGAILGSIVPGLGNALGAAIGGALGSVLGGAIGSIFGGGGRDQQFSIATAAAGSQGLRVSEGKHAGHYLFEGNRTRSSPFGTIGLLNADTSGTKGKVDDAILDTVLSFDEAIASVLDIRQTQIVARFLQQAQDGATQHASSLGEGDVGRALKDRLEQIAEALIGRPLQGLTDRLAEINDRDLGKIQSEGAKLIDIIALFSDGFTRGLKAMTGGFSPIERQVFTLQEAAKEAAKKLLESIDSIREAVALISPSRGEERESEKAIRRLALGSIGLGPDADRKELTGAALALREMTLRIKAMKPVLEEAGLTAAQATEKIERALAKGRRELRGDFNSSVRDQILAIKDPFQAALKELEEVQRQRIKDAKKLGGDLNAVHRLNNLERLELEKQYRDQSLEQLRSFVVDLKTGDLSTLSQTQQARVAERDFNRVSRRALNGNLDVGEFTSSATRYLEEQRALYGSSQRYQDAFKQVTDLSERLGIKLNQDADDRRAKELRADIKEQANRDRENRNENTQKIIVSLGNRLDDMKVTMEDLARVISQGQQEDVA